MANYELINDKNEFLFRLIKSAIGNYSKKTGFFIPFKDIQVFVRSDFKKAYFKYKNDDAEIITTIQISQSGFGLYFTNVNEDPS
jgi:hypothetical protein